MALRKKLAKVDPGTGGTQAPTPTPRPAGMKKPKGGLPTANAPAKMQATGTLSTGEHPDRAAYFKKTGKTKDPLEAAGGTVKRAFVNRTAGPRKGMTATEIMRGGAKYHVYYGSGGTRSVFRVPTRGERGVRKRAGRTGVSANRI